MMTPLSLFRLTLLLLTSLPSLHALSLTLRVPPHIPALPASSTAYLIAHNTSLRALVTRANTFRFVDLEEQGGKNYLLDVASKDWDFASYGVDVKRRAPAQGHTPEGWVAEVFRVARGGNEIGGAERLVVAEGEEQPVEVRVLRARDYYEARAGFNPTGLLKNPMILIGIVGLVFVVGMPYLLENMDPETRREFEEQQKKGVFGTGASASGASNPLQNFDMAAWMAGKQTEQRSGSPAAASGADAGGGSRARRRG